MLKIIRLSLSVVVSSLYCTANPNLRAQPNIGYLDPKAIIAKSPEYKHSRCFFSEAEYNGLWSADTFYMIKEGKTSMNIRLWTIDPERVVVALWADTFHINIEQNPICIHYRTITSNKNGRYAMMYKAQSDRYVVSIRPRKQISNGIIEETVLDTLEVEDTRSKTTLVKAIPAVNCW